ncbi:unnamed protein product [Dracunculus medinensis]|uniref:U6 snRNA-associated Sm-like protein LSm1 n=1 Tax=Dracunculus medinensis TaxID=318479 RepID=A0A0N4UIJ5_DRAME|nr:unnamed protein product [Dracunculus medinensis]
MEFNETYFPGSVSLLDQLDKKMLVILRDGKTLIGYLRTIDQFANLVLHEALERIYFEKYYGDIDRGVFLIRGENVVLAGEIDEEKEKRADLIRLPVEEILAMQRQKAEEQAKYEEAKNRILRGRGYVSALQDIMTEEQY